MTMKKTIIITTAILAGLCANAAPKLPAPTTPNPGLKYYYPVPKAKKPTTANYDVVVYGGTPGGVGAAIQARRMGKTSALYVFRRHVGGLTSAGLTETDIGKKNAIGGMAVEFFERVGKWRQYRPSEAERVFLEMLVDAGVPVFFEHRLEKVEKKDGKITKITFENGNAVKGKMFVDATYEGDLFAMAGCSYMVGREDNSRFNEDYNGTYFSKHSHIPRFDVDPYKVKGDPSSGLLEGITDTKVEKLGVADKKLQSYCFRMWAMKNGKKTPWYKPENYRPERYALLSRYVNSAPDPDFWNLRYSRGPLKLNEGDCNNAGPISLDHVGYNFGWAEGSYAEREKIFQDHVNYQQGFMYFLANDPSIPAKLRARINAFGLDAYEFPETRNWPHDLYIREARRLLSDYVMTQAHCTGKEVVKDSVGLGSYQMDSHHVERVVKDGKMYVEGGFEKKVKRSYPVSFKSIVPKRAECTNLAVPVALSASHVAFGSIRMEPVFMILGQSGATAACMAIDGNGIIQDVDYKKLRAKLLIDEQILDTPFVPKGKKRN
ncbi:MAG: FAD-dependent oxidoreductase [Opitutales bacterium]|nr:FAD-dependent oxidoreductase [Opitutales bacterium]